MLIELDRIARRYSADPWEVLQWPPERVALASMCLRAATQEIVDNAKMHAANGTHPIQCHQIAP